MTNEQRQAHDMFFQTELTQQQIADMLDINRKTLYLWIKEGGWKQAKYAAAHAPSVLIEQYYEQLGAINNHIASRIEQPWPSKEEAVTIRSLTTTIKNIRNGKHTVGESVEVFQHFTDKLRRKDLSLTKEILPHMTKHIKDLSEEASGSTSPNSASSRKPSTKNTKPGSPSSRKQMQKTTIQIPKQKSIPIPNP